MQPTALYHLVQDAIHLPFRYDYPVKCNRTQRTDSCHLQTEFLGSAADADTGHNIGFSPDTGILFPEADAKGVFRAAITVVYQRRSNQGGQA